MTTTYTYANHTLKKPARNLGVSDLLAGGVEIHSLSFQVDWIYATVFVPVDDARVLAVRRRRYRYDQMVEVMEWCGCMTEDPGDGYGLRVVTHSLRCPQHPDNDGGTA